MLHASQVDDQPRFTSMPSTGGIMRWVIIATLPGLATMTFFFGLGVVSNVVIAAAFGLGLEALVLRLRQRNWRPLNDASALLTGVLLGASLPPASPWWLIGIGMVAAIVVAKHLYGGLGHNPFNPAMVGYALLLVSFPTYMTLWPTPQSLWPATLGSQIMGSISLEQIDSLSGATPLDAFKHKADEVTASQFWANPPLPRGTLTAWQWVSAAWAVGGALLLARRLISWHIPVAMLGSMTAIATLLYWLNPDDAASPWLHLVTGATLFGAFFIATDPVSAATSQRGKLIYGAGIGLLVIVIRTWGGYPDAVAFAVLLMNLAAPTIDYYSTPRTYGHSKAKRGMGKTD